MPDIASIASQYKSSFCKLCYSIKHSYSSPREEYRLCPRRNFTNPTRGIIYFSHDRVIIESTPSKVGPAHPAPTQEALILITAKKLDEDRLIKPTSTSQDPTVKGVLRWKWLVICCCSHGYLRSNDKWDNLLRDYKKACESESNAQSKVYTLEKQDHRLRNLLSNMRKYY